MENSNLDLMFEDFIKRHEWDVTIDELKDAYKNNISYVTDDCFFIFNVYFGKFMILYAYAKPGTDIRSALSYLEKLALGVGCRKMAFATKRVKAFARAYKDYKQVGAIFEKPLKEGD